MTTKTLRHAMLAVAVLLMLAGGADAFLGGKKKPAEDEVCLSTLLCLSACA
jgi:hypothetical protein